MKAISKKIGTITMGVILLTSSVVLAQESTEIISPPLKLNGPRMGFVAYTGKNASNISRPKNEGGYDAVPLMYQFGYQFEKQYVGGGNLQGLFEFLPLITGLDQGMFIPSFTFMHGIRDNKSGWEIAFGPSVSLVKKADGYITENGVWHLENEWTSVDTSANNYGTPLPNPNPVDNRVDSRGQLAFSSSFVFAIGKTFRSGSLNIPVNMYVIPNKDGISFGASVGFNSRKS